jgi:hypothetical protein
MAVPGLPSWLEVLAHSQPALTCLAYSKGLQMDAFAPLFAISFKLYAKRAVSSVGIETWFFFAIRA